MCASAGQTQMGDLEMQAYQQAQQLTAQQYANQQAIYAPLAKSFQSIFDKGPNATGFSAGERNALNAQAVSGTAENYSQASKAVGESLAARGGGTNPLPSGADAELKGEIASSAAGTESKQENQIVQADYQQGYNKWLAAAGGLQTIAAGENPLGFEEAETGAGNAAANEENEISREDNSWLSAAIGAGGALGSAAITKWG